MPQTIGPLARALTAVHAAGGTDVSVFQNEVLIALSAFLFSWRRRDLGRTLTWLVEVYLFWTAVYLLESLALPARAVTSPFGRAEFLLWG